MPAYYNENDRYAAQWLRNLIQAGHIAPGDVDERSIVDVCADDLRGYEQCHFFAGIGGWSYALRLAGWSDSQAAWTGSPPCQDVSVAGASWGVRKGFDGARTSLVRNWLDLIEALKPSPIYFENVPGIKQWIAEIENRLESAGYAIFRSKLSTADVAGPHLRRRVWIAAYHHGARLQEPRQLSTRPIDYRDSWGAPPGNVWVAAPDRVVGMADGFPARVDAIRAFGNAIIPQVAAEFIVTAHSAITGVIQ